MDEDGVGIGEDIPGLALAVVVVALGNVGIRSTVPLGLASRGYDEDKARRRPICDGHSNVVVADREVRSGG